MQIVDLKTLKIADPERYKRIIFHRTIFSLIFFLICFPLSVFISKIYYKLHPEFNFVEFSSTFFLSLFGLFFATIKATRWIAAKRFGEIELEDQAREKVEIEKSVCEYMDSPERKNFEKIWMSAVVWGGVWAVVLIIFAAVLNHFFSSTIALPLIFLSYTIYFFFVLQFIKKSED